MGKRLSVIMSFAATVVIVLGETGFGAAPLAQTPTFYVAPDGNDAWSGRFPVSNADKTGGPFGSLERARDGMRELKRKGLPKGGITVLVRGGTYFLPEPLRFEPQDSGNEDSPVTYAAYPGETPIISGGRPIGPWRREGELFAADVPEVAQGDWYFRQIFVGEERQIRARTPNFDPRNPCCSTTCRTPADGKLAGQDLRNPQGLTEPLTPRGTWHQWQEAGFDQHSLVADPLFVDPGKDDYRLKPNSPALELGFEPIPLDKIGALQD